MNSLNQATFLLKIEKARAYTRLGDRVAAEVESMKALGIVLEIAEKQEYQAAVRLFKTLIALLQEGNYLQSAWAEIYVTLAICHARLNNNSKKQEYFKMAHELEPDNNDLRELAIQHGFDWT